MYSSIDLKSVLAIHSSLHRHLNSFRNELAHGSLDVAATQPC